MNDTVDILLLAQGEHSAPDKAAGIPCWKIYVAPGNGGILPRQRWRLSIKNNP